MRVIISGGGTAGHVYPGLALLKALASDSLQTEVLYVGSERGLESSLIKAAGYRFEGLDVLGFPRKISISGTVAALKMAKAFFAARAVVKRFQPDVVVGTGAYVSVPVLLAAAFARIPTVIHEQNSIPGLANRLLGKWATRVALSFPDTERFFPRASGVELTGNPVREDIIAAERRGAKERLGLDLDAPVLLIFGGSQGARCINDAAIGGANELLARGIQVVHSTGELDYNKAKEALGERSDKGYLLLPYIEDMAGAYSAADLVVARAGATTVAEITALGIASILVPYPYATADHQESNARALERAGGAKVILDKDFDSNALVSNAGELLGDPDRLIRMGLASGNLGKPDAAERLARVVRDAAALSNTRKTESEIERGD